MNKHQRLLNRTTNNHFKMLSNRLSACKQNKTDCKSEVKAKTHTWWQVSLKLTEVQNLKAGKGDLLVVGAHASSLLSV